ncbi:MAG: gamma-glutamyltransferase, partial [Gammaproteobacteria bacterium]|nr:gamma-glutamyltransferase [Gammaproteobacteria bacterium]
MRRRKGVVAAGHEVTASAAAEVLKAGGNAFDAALAALFASCVAEPVLASLGGGGFLLAERCDARKLLYDFFAQTPFRKRSPEETDFYPIIADFGTVQQEFHIGMGSIATPGVVKGLFAIHRELCSMPLQVIIQPACEAARSGVAVNNLQRYISKLVSPILQSTPDAMALHATRETPDRFAECGEKVH